MQKETATKIFVQTQFSSSSSCRWIMHSGAFGIKFNANRASLSFASAWCAVHSRWFAFKMHKIVCANALQGETISQPLLAHYVTSRFALSFVRGLLSLVGGGDFASAIICEHFFALRSIVAHERREKGQQKLIPFTFRFEFINHERTEHRKTFSMWWKGVAAAWLFLFCIHFCRVQSEWEHAF